MNVDELRDYIQADSLAFISIEGMERSVRGVGCDNHLCCSCFSGDYVTKLYDSFEKANKERK